MTRVFPRHAVVVIPSVPAMGKTMRNGLLFERGIPAHETDYGRDPVSPLCTNDARQILESTGRFAFDLEDAETDEDVERGVSRALDRGNVILAGSVALADCLAHRVERTSWKAECSTAPRRILLLCGSQYALARSQMLDAARAFGEAIVDVGDSRTETALPDRRGILLVQIDTTQIRAGHARRKLPSLFRRARRIIRSYAPEAVGFVGGETAYRILRMLGTTRLVVIGREQLGIPYGRILDGELSGCQFITKGGSVGTPDACRLMVGRLAQ